MGKRLAECDITLWRHIVSFATPHPLPYGATRTTLRQVILRLKRCAVVVVVVVVVVRTYMLHLHHSITLKRLLSIALTSIYLEC